jgi:hypothetical protein
MRLLLEKINLEPKSEFLILGKTNPKSDKENKENKEVDINRSGLLFNKTTLMKGRG